MATITLTQISNGDSGDATVVDSNFDTIANEVNGNLDNSNIASGADISLTKLASDAWASWTPVWTNLTIGDGVVDAATEQVGSTMRFRIGVLFGSTTSVGGQIDVQYPVTPKDLRATATGSVHRLARAVYTDASAVTQYEGTVTFNGTTTMRLLSITTSGTYATASGVTATVPFTWAVGDSISIQGEFEVA